MCVKIHVDMHTCFKPLLLIFFNASLPLLCFFCLTVFLLLLFTIDLFFVVVVLAQPFLFRFAGSVFFFV